jgi:hypothetical protein
MYTTPASMAARTRLGAEEDPMFTTGRRNPVLPSVRYIRFLGIVEFSGGELEQVGKKADPAIPADPFFRKSLRKVYRSVPMAASLHQSIYDSEIIPAYSHSTADQFLCPNIREFIHFLHNPIKILYCGEAFAVSMGYIHWYGGRTV